MKCMMLLQSDKMYLYIVHCAADISRSASVIIAYLMKYNNMNYDKAYKYVKDIRTCIKLNIGFVQQ